MVGIGDVHLQSSEALRGIIPVGESLQPRIVCRYKIRAVSNHVDCRQYAVIRDVKKSC
jgi:hypothetical protein